MSEEREIINEADKLIKLAESLKKSKSIIEEATKIIELSKKSMKLLYQLAFVATSDSVLAERADQILKELVQKGLYTYSQVEKAKNDVRRWRDYKLDFLRPSARTREFDF